MALGDEPVYLAHELPGCIVIRGRDRYLAGLAAIARNGCTVCILDDGFQFRKLYRDIDILMLHGERPEGKGLLPRSHLREGPQSMKRADLLVNCERWGGDGGAPSVDGDIPPGIPSIKASIAVDGIRLLGADQEPANHLDPGGKKVLAFAGIGDPKSFQYLIEGLSPGMLHSVFYNDHFKYPLKSVETLNRTFDRIGADLMLTTEKDAVKLKADFFGGRPCWVVSAKLIIDEGQECLDEMLAMCHVKDLKSYKRTVSIENSSH
jgi:tetraacyldisaccharide 4'-kinase